MSFSESMCLQLNKIFPKHVEDKLGRKSPIDYSRAQYSWADVSFSFFNEFIDLRNKTVLDAGCSLGGKTVKYAQEGCKSIIGIDIDNRRLEHAKKFAELNNSNNIEFRLGSISEMPFNDNSFDIIFLNDVVEHINNKILESALSECKRVLKGGGRICIEFPPWHSHDASHLYDYISIPWCHLLFSDETLFNVVRKMKEVPTFTNLDPIEHYQELNRITSNQFDEYIRNIGFKIIHRRDRMIKNISLLKFLPLINKYFVTRSIYILSK